MTEIPNRMRMVQLLAPGGADAMSLADRPVPEIGPNDLLIRVQAAGVNRPDIAQRRGAYPPPVGASPVMGLEVAGDVVAAGSDVTAFGVGDRVCGLANGGGYAEFCAVPAGQCLPWPRGYDAVRAAALPETYFTVWANLFEMGRLAEGESALIHGGSSGIGVTAIQLAVALGSQVYVTAGSPEKCAACCALGASAAINYRQDDFLAEIRRLTNKRGVDVVLDMVGAPYTERNLRCLAMDGRLIQIAFLEGSTAQTLDLMPIMQRRLTVTGSTMRPRTAAQKAAIADALRARVWPLLDAGRCGPVIHSTFPLADVADAHRLMESSTHIGKIMLTMD